jgi:hypothetical protein
MVAGRLGGGHFSSFAYMIIQTIFSDREVKSFQTLYMNNSLANGGRIRSLWSSSFLIFMGVSAQQHRVVTGCFESNLGSSVGGAASHGKSKQQRKSAKNARNFPESGGCPTSTLWWHWLLLLLTAMVNITRMVVVPPLMMSISQSLVNSATLSQQDYSSPFLVQAGLRSLSSTSHSGYKAPAGCLEQPWHRYQDYQVQLARWWFTYWGFKPFSSTRPVPI